LTLAKRIIPCLDIKDGLVVKGRSFLNLKEMGDPVELASRYRDEGADEIVLLDIMATQESRKTMSKVVKKVARKLDIPFTVGGGINSKEIVKELLSNGADKVSINTSAVLRPHIVKELSDMYGSQCIVVSIDAKKEKGKYSVYIKSGKKKVELDPVEWAEKVESLGAGELLITSIDRDGHQSGYDIELLSSITKKVNIPVIASGGCGKKEDFLEAFNAGCDAALAASLFHTRKISILEVKEFLKSKGICVRL
jgi:cyclase